MKLEKEGIELYDCLEYCKRGCSPNCKRYRVRNNSNVCAGNLMKELQEWIGNALDYIEETEVK